MPECCCFFVLRNIAELSINSGLSISSVISYIKNGCLHIVDISGLSFTLYNLTSDIQDLGQGQGHQMGQDPTSDPPHIVPRPRCETVTAVASVARQRTQDDRPKRHKHA